MQNTNWTLKPLTAEQKAEADRRVRDGEVDLEAAIVDFWAGYNKQLPIGRKRKRKPAGECLPLPFATRASDNLNPKQAASYLGISEKTLANLRCYGGGPAYQQPRRLVTYRVADLDAFLASGHRRNTSERYEVSQ